MEILAVLFLLLAGVCGIGSLVCFIMVLVKMFQNDQSTLGIVCIVLALCTGIGALIAFVVGWMNARAWNIQQVMLAWTGCIVGGFILWLVGFVIMAMAGAQHGGQF